LSSRPLIFQRDGRILLNSSDDHDGSASRLMREIGELVSAAGDIHTYRITDLSLWASISTGWTGCRIQQELNRLASTEMPALTAVRIDQFFARYGTVRLEGSQDAPRLFSDDATLLPELADIVGYPVVDRAIPIPPLERGPVKALLASAGFPVVDNVPVNTSPRVEYRMQLEVSLRDYQRSAADRFIEHAPQGGLILLPCGAGKTVVGVAIAEALKARTLVIVPNRTIGEQWAEHFLSMTDLRPSQISLFDMLGEDSAISIVTYQSLTSSEAGTQARLARANDIPWGLVIYDEVHSLPADVFRTAAGLQSRRRLGLTATLVREDGREREVFALVGPPVWQSRWRDLEESGWISPVECYEVRVRSQAGDTTVGDRGFAAKMRVVERIQRIHGEDQMLVVAHHLREVRALSRRLEVPMVTGETSQSERTRLYGAFRRGDLRCLVASRVANVGVDLPDANVLVQVSGTFGSRLEEAQRVGRLLRPKVDRTPARFYSLVLPDTREREFAERRQRFLVDQGYRYKIVRVTA
jgi:DNA excision repair protein ERCC-3